MLGGVHVPSDVGLDGHSDADVLTHAIVDALLGAAGLGDIGQHFPDTDERYAGVDSLVLLRESVRLVGTAGYEIVNIDSTLALEVPKLGEFRAQMRELIAAAAGIDSDRVNIKATTGEAIGFVGRQEGAAALAVATISTI